MKFIAITHDKYKNIRGYSTGSGHIFVPDRYLASANWNLRLVHDVLIKAGFSCSYKKDLEFEIVENSSEEKEKILEVLAYEIKRGIVDLKYA